MTTVNAVGVSLSGQTGTGSFAGSTSPTFAGPIANNFLEGYSATTTAAATTTLTASSNYFQFFTGSTTQTVALPVTSTLVLGQSFYIVNNSTGVVTVQSSGGNTIQAMASGSTLLVTCILTSGTSAASWNAQYLINADLSGAVLLNPGADQSIIAHNLFLTNGGFISGSATGPVASATAVIQSVGVGTAGTLLSASYTNTAGSPNLFTYKSRSTTPGSFVTVQASDFLLNLEAWGDDGTQFTPAGKLVWQAIGTISSGVIPSTATFQTANASGVLSNVWVADQNQNMTFSGEIIPSQTKGIVGTTTNNNAQAGSVGEIISSVIALASAVSLTNNTAANVTTISLTAGDWDIFGNVGLNGGSTTVLMYYSVWASTSGGTTPDPSLWNGQSYGVAGLAVFAENQVGEQAPFLRLSLASTTTVYLSVIAGFTTSTCVAYGGIFARRVR